MRKLSGWVAFAATVVVSIAIAAIVFAKTQTNLDHLRGNGTAILGSAHLNFTLARRFIGCKSGYWLALAGRVGPC